MPTSRVDGKFKYFDESLKNCLVKFGLQLENNVDDSQTKYFSFCSTVLSCMSCLHLKIK